MALPEILMPAGLPPFMASEHVIKPEGIYGKVPRQLGTDRRRRLFTTVPTIVETAIEVTQAQLESFYAWHKGPLKSGELEFTAAIAKFGVGLDYWRAKCLAFSAEHFQGDTHKITLTLRLFGTPEATAPGGSTMATEFVVPLDVSTTGGADPTLLVEFFGILAFSVAAEDSLAAEFGGPLRTEFAGPLAGNPLEVDFRASVEMYLGVLPSEALAVEFSAALDAYAQDQLLLSVEFAAALTVAASDSSSLGWVDPANFAISSSGSPWKGASAATLRVSSNGLVYSRLDAGAFAVKDYLYVPFTPGIGNGKWVRATELFGSSFNVVITATGVAVQIPVDGALDWKVQQPFTQAGVGAVTATLLIEVANDPDILDVISEFEVDLSAEYL